MVINNMEDFSKISRSLLGQMHVRSSALNPLLWLTALSGLICLPAAYFIPTFASWLVATPIICFVATLIAFAYFAYKDPNRLQSEEYQIRQQKMQYQLMQGSQKIEVIEDGQLLPNPALSGTASSGRGAQ